MMSSCVDAQLPLLIVQRTVALLPAAIPVTVVVGIDAFVIVAEPSCTLHRPVPTVAVFPAIVNVPLLHWLMSTPASAVVGRSLLVSTTSSVLAAHTGPLLIVQRSVTLLPAWRPVT